MAGDFSIHCKGKNKVRLWFLHLKSSKEGTAGDSFNCSKEGTAGDSFN